MIIYKITNLINDKIYVGKDSNDNPSYLSSGLLIQKQSKNIIKKILN